jgi:hypothetical protein
MYRAVSEKLRGRQRPPRRQEWSKRISEAKKGKPSSKRGKRDPKMSERQLGPNNPFWKGGVTKLTNMIRHMDEYVAWRTAIFRRDNYACTECGSRKNGRLVVHHIFPLKFILLQYHIQSLDGARVCPVLWDTSNGSTMCRECHQLTDNFGVKIRGIAI